MCLEMVPERCRGSTALSETLQDLACICADLRASSSPRPGFWTVRTAFVKCPIRSRSTP